MLNRIRITTIYFLALISIVFLFVSYSQAAYNEQMAIDPVSVALSNTCTAMPPGIASVHFNPAGLTKLPDGKLAANGFSHVRMFRTVRATPDMNFEGLMNTFGPQEGQRHDPMAGVTGHNTSTDIFIPGVGTLYFLALPTSAQAYHKPESRWYFARAVVAPFMGGFSHKDPNDPDRYFAKELYSERINYLSPGVGYRVNDNFSIGMTAAAGMTLFGLKRDVRVASDMSALTKILGEATENLEIPVLSEETLPPPWFGGGIDPYKDVAHLEMALHDYFSPSFNLGVLWEPVKWFSFGAVYQSPIKNELTGKYVLTYENQFRRMVDWYGSTPLLRTNAAMLDLPTQSVPYQKGTVKMEDWDYPQRVQLGIMLRPVKRVKLLCDLHWANWSTWKELKLFFDEDIQAFQFAKLNGHIDGNRVASSTTGLYDTFHWSYATEIDLTDKMCLRLGYEFRPTSTPIKYFSLGSMPDLKKYGIGLGFKFKNGMTLDISYGYADTGDYYIPSNASDNLNSTSFVKSEDSPFPGLDFMVRTQIHIITFNITEPVPGAEEKAVRKKDKLKKIKQNIHHLVTKLKSLNPFRKK